MSAEVEIFIHVEVWDIRSRVFLVKGQTIILLSGQINYILKNVKSIIITRMLPEVYMKRQEFHLHIELKMSSDIQIASY